MIGNGRRDDEKAWSRHPDIWHPYILVDDVKASTQKAQALGVTMAKDVTEVPGRRWFSVIIDPIGAAFGLWPTKMAQ